MMNEMINFNTLVKGDKLPEGDAAYFIVLLSTLGGFLIISEIVDEFPEFFSGNTIKKIILWSFIYTQTKSIGGTSLYSIIIVLLFPTVFFGKPSGVKLKAKEEKKEQIEIKNKVSTMWDETH